MDRSQIIFDASTSRWRLKEAILGGLPNSTDERRKTVPLAAKFRKPSSCTTGVLVVRDERMRSDQQQSCNAYGNIPSHMPGNEPIPVHCAEVLRQVEAASSEKKFVCGDARLGSVMACVELFVRRKMFSTFMVKNNTSAFPKEQLLAILKARHGKNPQGNWVVMTSTIAGSPIIALAYASSNTDVSFFVSSCGQTTTATEPCHTSFDDACSGDTWTAVPRPDLVDWLYQKLPLSDEYSKQRQKLLGLEKSWPTKTCGFKLTLSILGLAITDCHMLYCYMDEHYNSVTATRFAGMLCTNMPRRSRDGRCLGGTIGDQSSTSGIRRRGCAVLKNIPLRKKLSLHQAQKYNQKKGSQSQSLLDMPHASSETTTYASVLPEL